jgi:hypothetical protein
MRGSLFPHVQHSDEMLARDVFFFCRRQLNTDYRAQFHPYTTLPPVSLTMLAKRFVTIGKGSSCSGSDNTDYRNSKRRPSRHGFAHDFHPIQRLTPHIAVCLEL